ELFGWFEMGSTIVILSQKDAIEYRVRLDQYVKFGEVIGELNDN
ncbi:MAG: phosphatidylserine decarboxylase, partial [Epsilonproteobacteria bacterium]|nr:phosphatidylserine decarboxylase [Campylobacterota bacterium]